MDSVRNSCNRTANGYVSTLAGRGILDMKRKWTMKRIVDTLFVLVILGGYRDADHVRCDLHQDLKDAGGNHMDIGHALITIAMIVNKAIP